MAKFLRKFLTCFVSLQHFINEELEKSRILYPQESLRHWCDRVACGEHGFHSCGFELNGTGVSCQVVYR